MKFPPFYQKIIFGVVFYLSFSLYLAQIAHALTPTEEQELRDRSRRALEERERVLQEKDVHLQEPTQKEQIKELPIEENSFIIDQIIIEGDLVHRFGWTQKIVDQYAGQKIGFQGLEIILTELTEGAIERGMVTTRFQVGEQDLSTGILRIQIIPGRIGTISFSDQGQKGSWVNSFPTRPGRILDMRDLEQGLEQMKKVPSQDVKMELQPGENLGETDIIITMKKEKAWRVGFSVDDSGSESTGKYQGTTSISVDNALQHNDTFTYYYIHDLDRHSRLKGNHSHSYYYNMPLGYWNFSFSAFPSKYYQTVMGISSYKYSGQSQNYVLKAQRVIHRDTDSKSTVDFSIGRKFSKSFLDDTEIRSQRKNNTTLNFGISKRKNFDTGLVDVRLGFQKGVLWLGADRTKTKIKDFPTNNYLITTLDLNFLQYFSLGKLKMRYSFDFKGQATGNRLFGSEYFNIGGRYTVRGFDGENNLSAENGFYLRNELGIPIEPLNLELYFGVDYGQVTGPSTKYLKGNKLAGSVVGLRGSVKDFYYDVFVGTPFYKPKGFDAPKTVYGFQVGYQY